jgi:hypothetical protein
MKNSPALPNKKLTSSSRKKTVKQIQIKRGKYSPGHPGRKEFHLSR